MELGHYWMGFGSGLVFTSRSELELTQD